MLSAGEVHKLAVPLPNKLSPLKVVGVGKTPWQCTP
jgi:hypothetical protein